MLSSNGIEISSCIQLCDSFLNGSCFKRYLSKFDILNEHTEKNTREV